MEAEINQAIDSIIVESTDTIIEDNLLEDTTPEDTETNQIDQETLTKTINDLLEIVEELETSKNDLSASLSLNEELLASLTIEAETRQSTLEQLSSQIEELSEKASKIDEVDRLFNLISSHEIIGPLANKIVSGEEIEVPEYLQRYVLDSLQSLPQFREDNSKTTTHISVRNPLESALGLKG